MGAAVLEARAIDETPDAENPNRVLVDFELQRKIRLLLKPWLQDDGALTLNRILNPASNGSRGGVDLGLVKNALELHSRRAPWRFCDEELPLRKSPKETFLRGRPVGVDLARSLRGAEDGSCLWVFSEPFAKVRGAPRFRKQPADFRLGKVFAFEKFLAPGAIRAVDINQTIAPWFESLERLRAPAPGLESSDFVFPREFPPTGPDGETRAWRNPSESICFSQSARGSSFTSTTSCSRARYIGRVSRSNPNRRTVSAGVKPGFPRTISASQSGL